MFAGANDVFFQLDVFAARMNSGDPVQQALAQGLALEAMAQAALDLAAEVRRIVRPMARRASRC